MNLTKIETNYRRNMFLSKQEGLKVKENNKEKEKGLIEIYPDIRYQTIVGFGGAFTGAGGYALSKTTGDVYDKIMSEYFGSDGIGYTLCRTHIGSCDFCKSTYSYLYEDDISKFSIEEDRKYLIPMIKKAMEKEGELQLLASPWSPPAFMKDNNSLILGGKLLPEHRKLWSEYIVRYLEEYKKEGINIFYMTIQNEPNAKQVWESCLYTASEEAELVVDYLYPTLRKNNFDTKLFIWDHNKEKLLERAKESFSIKNARTMIDGIAFHWYSGDYFDNIELTSNYFSDKLLFHTEGCTGYSDFRKSDEVKNAEIYGHDILGDLNHNCNGFMDWNMVLDYKGGPNHKFNYCNSPIMINKDNTDYIKNLTFYYIAHFSKYIKPGATRIANSKFTENIEVTAFENPNKTIVVVLLNRNDFNIEYDLCIKDTIYHDNLDKHCIVTFLVEE